MRVGFWSAPEADDVEMTVLPVAHNDGDPRRGRTAAGGVAALASLDGAALAAQYPGATALFPRLEAALAAQRADAPGRGFPLDGLSEDERQLIGDVLGEGEVAGIVALPDGGVAQIQESVLAGLWRVHVEGGNAAFRDYLEVGAIPNVVSSAAIELTSSDLFFGAPPDGVMNVMPVLAEIRERIATHRPGGDSHIVNFTLFPMSPADMAFLQATLGSGPVRLFSRGYGNCRVLATGVRHVWSVQFTNSMDAVILDTLEIGDLPAAARAAAEDFRDSAARLSEIIAAYLQ